MPPGTRLDVIIDSSVFTRNSLNGVQRELIEAVLLVGVVLLIFLHTWRSTFIVLLAIPTSLIATFIVMLSMDITLNTMSLLGLTLTIGALVDDSIVVLENTFRHLELGETPLTAAINGRSEIGVAAIAITLVDVVIFAPIAFLSGITGQFFREFGLVIVAAVLFSLLVSFTLTPMLASRWLRAPRPDDRGLLARFGRVWEAGYSRVANRYRALLAWSLRHRWPVIAAGVASLAAGSPAGCRELRGRRVRPRVRPESLHVAGRDAPRHPAGDDRPGAIRGGGQAGCLARGGAHLHIRWGRGREPARPGPVRPHRGEAGASTRPYALVRGAGGSRARHLCRGAIPEAPGPDPLHSRPGRTGDPGAGEGRRT